MNTKQPILHLVFLMIVLSAVSYMFYRTEEGFVEVNKLLLEVSKQEVNIDKLTELNSALPNFSTEMSTYLKTLPTNESDVADFALLLEQNAKEVGLTISNHFDDFPKQVDVSGRNIPGLGMEITLEGSFQDLTRFFTRLSNLPYFFRTDKITILSRDTKLGVKAVINGFLMMNIEKK